MLKHCASTAPDGLSKDMTWRAPFECNHGWLRVQLVEGHEDIGTMLIG